MKNDTSVILQQLLKAVSYNIQMHFLLICDDCSWCFLYEIIL